MNIVEFIAKMSTLTRIPGNPIASRVEGYLGEPTVLSNPLNLNELLYFCSNGNGVVRGTAPVSDPFNVTGLTDAPIFGPDPTTTANPDYNPADYPTTPESIPAWDSYFVRKGNVWAEGTTLYMPYSGCSFVWTHEGAMVEGEDPYFDPDGGEGYWAPPGGNGFAFNSIGIAISTDGGITWSRHAGNPTKIPTAPHNNNAYPSIIKIGETYHQHYVCSIFAEESVTHTIAHDTSDSKFGPWTELGPVMPWRSYYETCLAIPLDDGLALLYDQSPQSGIYTVWLATAPDTDTPFTDNSMILAPLLGTDPATVLTSDGPWDGGTVATVGVSQINGQQVLFYQGSWGRNQVPFKLGAALSPTNKLITRHGKLFTRGGKLQVRIP